LIVKDYYNTLQLKPDAAAWQIKQAYRRLALRHHPDTNKSDPYAAAVFNDIKEAFDVLSHPQKRALYHQQRWLQLNTGKNFAATQAHTPHTLVLQAISLYNNVCLLDEFRMDKNLLFQQLKTLLATNNIAMLQRFNDVDANNKIFDILLNTSKFLNAHHLQQLQPLLLCITENPVSATRINSLIKRKQQQQLWGAYKPYVIVGAALIIATVIFLLGQ
jgi:curved DNA-binding protein CbpA